MTNLHTEKKALFNILKKGTSVATLQSHMFLLFIFCCVAEENVAHTDMTLYKVTQRHRLQNLL